LIEFGTANGGWAIVPSPDPAGRQGNSLIDAVQAFGSRNVWAVGTFDGKGGTRTLILQRTGRP
jgi:hypothetical protein